MKTAIHYMTNDGERFEASTPLEVIHHLRSSMWLKSDATHEEFMRDMAERVREQTGTQLDTSTVENFVTTLVATGLLKIEEANE